MIESKSNNNNAYDSVVYDVVKTRLSSLQAEAKEYTNHKA